MKLAYCRGTILIYGVPDARRDEHSKSYRAQAFYYRDIKNYLKEYHLKIAFWIFCHPHIYDPAWKYQKEAMERWMREKR